MSDTVIQVENLGKKYIIGHQQQERYTALRDVIANGAKSFGQRLLKPWGKQSANPAYEEFWALKDVSFDVKQGDRIGIIGRNGAGKSTLLKILSRITEPTTGKIRIKGRVASLLEVGTGFHPELTGRENIFLNGAILGMSKAEIKRKFDEIVDFAGIEKFLDTPVKRYSSGMYVRLAFAVAAHLEPEILIVDEVLAVGDTAFQKKCLGKMEDVGKEGRTVLFVSHDMRAIQKLCNQAMLLVQGNCSILNSVNNVIDLYISVPDKNTDKHELLNLPRRPGLGLKARIDKVELLNSLNKSVEELKFGEYFSLKVRCLVLEPINNISFVIGIDSILKTRITTLISDSKTSISRGEIIESKVNLNKLLLNPGYYYVTVGLVEYKICLDRIEHAKGFRVNQVSANPEFIDKEIVTYGLLQVPDAEWVIKSSKSNRLHNQVRYSKHGFNKRNY